MKQGAWSEIKAANGRQLARWLLILLPLALQACLILVHLVTLVSVRNDTTYPEGANVYAFISELHTGKVYLDPLRSPFNGQIYGPVFYMVGIFVAKLVHGDPALTTEFMRGVSLFSLLGSAVVIARICRRLEGNNVLAISAGVISFACVWLLPYGSSVRSDSLAVFLFMCALDVYLQARQRSHMLVFAGLLAALACLTKQPLLAPTFGLIVDCLLAKKPRNLIALVTGLALLPCILLPILLLRHEPLLVNLTLARYSTTSWSRVYSIILIGLRENELFLVVLSLIAIGLIHAWKDPEYRVLLLVIVFGTITSIAAIQNLGSYTNYLILPWILGLVFVPAGAKGLFRWTQGYAVPVVIGLISVFIVLHQRKVIPARPPDLNGGPVAQSRLLTDNGYLAVRSTKPELLDPFFYNQKAMLPKWPSGTIADNIEKEEYDLIILEAGGHEDGSLAGMLGSTGEERWGSRSISAMASYYRVVCRADGEITMVPKDRSIHLERSKIETIYDSPC